MFGLVGCFFFYFVRIFSRNFLFWPTKMMIKFCAFCLRKAILTERTDSDRTNERKSTHSFIQQAQQYTIASRMKFSFSKDKRNGREGTENSNDWMFQGKTRKTKGETENTHNSLTVSLCRLMPIPSCAFRTTNFHRPKPKNVYLLYMRGGENGTKMYFTVLWVHHIFIRILCAHSTHSVVYNTQYTEHIYCA